MFPVFVKKLSISDPDDYTAWIFGIKGWSYGDLKKFKKDIRDQAGSDFQERITQQLKQLASPQEEDAYRALLEIPFTQKGEHRSGNQQELQRVGLQKAMFSSPFAAHDSTDRRIRLLQAKPEITPDEKSEVEALEKFATPLRHIDAARFSKFQRLAEKLQSPVFNWKPSDSSDSLVIFSERIETLNWLKDA